MPAIRNSTLNTDHSNSWRRRRVADQRLVRPVVGVGDRRLPGRFGRPRPRRSTRRTPSARADARRRARCRCFIAYASRSSSSRRVVAEQALVVRGDRCDRRGAVGGERDRVGRRVVGVGAHRRLQPRRAAPPAARRGSSRIASCRGLRCAPRCRARRSLRDAASRRSSRARRSRRGPRSSRAAWPPIDCQTWRPCLDVGARVDDRAVLADAPPRASAARRGGSRLRPTAARRTRPAAGRPGHTQSLRVVLMTSSPRR